MSARTILKHLHQQGRMTDYQFDVINRNLKERPQGHWYEKRIDEQYGNPPHGFLTRYEWRCSECEDVPCYEHDIHTLNFCPNCGAKMMKEGEE